MKYITVAAITSFFNLKVASSECHTVKILSTTVGYSLFAMIIDLCRHLTYNSRGAWHTRYAMLLSKEEHGIQGMPCSSQIISKMLPEIQWKSAIFSNL